MAVNVLPMVIILMPGQGIISHDAALSISCAAHNGIVDCFIFEGAGCWQLIAEIINKAEMRYLVIGCFFDRFQIGECRHKNIVACPSRRI